MTELVYARDKISYEYLLELNIDNQRIRLAPDFTTLIKGTFTFRIYNIGKNYSYYSKL